MVETRAPETSASREPSQTAAGLRVAAGTGRVARRPPAGLLVAALAALLVVSMLVAAAFGAVSLPIDEIVRMVGARALRLPIAATWPAQDESILFAIRLPRVFGAALVGAALAGAGVLFQGLLRNPLADP